MKYFLLLSLLAVSSSYAQISDDFSDGDFTANPVWSGDAAKFEVDAAKQLHLNAPAITDTAYLYTSNSLINDIEWNFFFFLDFSPSASNYLKVYLVSDQPNFKQPLNGYFLKMGENGSSDAIDLYLNQGTKETLIIAGIDGHVAGNTNSVSVRVTRDGLGTWAIYSDTTGGINYTLEGTAVDNTITSTSYFGFFCNYTSSRSTSFYFDNVFAGAPVVDVDPPAVLQVIAVSPNQLDIQYSEAVEISTAENELNYSVNNGIGEPASALIDAGDPSLVHLTFASNFPNGQTSSITISSVEDLSGNILNTISFDFTFYVAQPADVLINEIFPDPSPPVSLPEEEYAELFNHSIFPVDLGGWTFSDGTSTSTLSTFTLQPDSFLILCSSTNIPLFQPYGPVMGLSSFPSLNNDGDILTLKDASGNVISEVSYDLSWYHDDVKSEGGWSIERISANSACPSGANWHASMDVSGGTPGKKNSDLSAFTDTSPPQLLSAAVIDHSTIALFFNEEIEPSTIPTASFAILPSPPNITSAMPGGDLTEVYLTIDPGIDSNTVYTVTVIGLSDCTGNATPLPDSVLLAIPSFLQTGDILINEILFNPTTDGYDYVEIYNNTDKIFDLKDLQVANADDFDSLETISEIIPESYLFFPQQYIVLTENSDWVRQNYFVQNPDWLIEVTDLPSYNDDEGSVILVTNTNQRIDELHYSDRWHFALIDNTEGVSLERLDFNRPTQDSMNWHSAASSAGYGTPSYKNSQYSEPNTGNEIMVSPVVFSPDEDGHHDVLNISYQFDKAGYTANVRIFDNRGREVRNLIHNALLSQTGTFTWDGVMGNEEKAGIGSYIIFVEVFDLDGTVKHYKEICVVAAKKS